MFPVILLLAGCAASTVGSDTAIEETTGPGAAAPQQVDAVSAVLGARMNTMLSNSGGGVTR